MTKSYYTSKIEQLELERKDVQGLENKLSNFRLLGVILFFGSFYLAATSHPIWLVASVLIFVGFYFLVKKHGEVRNNYRQKSYEIDFFTNEINILEGKKNNYYDGSSFETKNHDFVNDLDVFGPFSLYSLFNRCVSYRGKTLLAEYFLLKPTQLKVAEIHNAISELQEHNTWKEKFLSSLYELLESQKDSTKAIYNFKFTDTISNKGLVLALKWGIPIVWIVALVLSYYMEQPSILIATFFGVLAVNYWVVGRHKVTSERVFEQTSNIYQSLQPLQQAVSHIQSQAWASGTLSTLQNQIPKTIGNPIESFGHIVKKLDMRKNQFAAFFLYLWGPFDAVQLIKLEKWHQQNPSYFKDTLEVIANFEVLCSFSHQASQKDWSLPHLSSEPALNFEGIQMGHPLIKDGGVRNDFTLNLSNRLSLITGSNMSGKSTFLRVVGVNVLLAYMGAPVCCKKLKLSEGFKMLTYMRIKDDLEQSVSTFKAEIDRVKKIVSAINNTNETYLFLIDEMLRGTNSEDKLKGSIALLEKIARSHTYALVATHDLRATDISESYPDTIQNFYFEFENKGDELLFDYQIKRGVCQSFNASILLEKAGLTT